MKLVLYILGGAILLAIITAGYFWYAIFSKVGYKIEKDKVVYIEVRPGGLALVTRDVVGADFTTFKVIKESREGLYAADQNHVFYHGRIVEGADPESFRITRPLKDAKISYPDTFIDKSAVWIEGGRLNAHVDSFQNLGGLYSRDKDNIYHQRKNLEGADIHTFEYLLYDFARDRNHVYLNGRILEDVEPSSFSVDKSGARDKSRKFDIYGNPIP